MFCMNCGTELPEGAKLEVDVKQKAAICPYCNSAYIVEQAINNINLDMTGNLNVTNATINVSGVSVDNLFMRAKEFETHGEFEKALDYYNKVLDIDVTRIDAKEGNQRMQEAIDNYVYYRTAANSAFTSGYLLLQMRKLVYVTNKGKQTLFNLNEISNLSKHLGCIQFSYPGKISTVSFSCSKAKELIQVIVQAQSGFYPEIKGNSSLSIEKYIQKNFTSNTKVKAIKYYREQTGVGLKEAKDVIDQILY